MNDIESSVKQSLKDLNLENFDLLLLPVQGMDKSALTVSQPAVQLQSAASKSDLTAGPILQGWCTVPANSLPIYSSQRALRSQSSCSHNCSGFSMQKLVSVL